MQNQPMQITVNGESQHLSGDTDTEVSLADLLLQLEIDARTVAIELSGEVIPRASFPNKVLVDGDKVEIVRFVQGG